MFRWIARSLGNMSVKLKLSVGFGLVLLLTLAITVTGWHGLDTMIDRSESLSSIGELSNMTKDLRAERVTFRVEDTAESASRVFDRLNEIEAHLSKLRSDVDNEQSVGILTEQSQLV
ncbi:MAG: methyl-accepting chemotaxis protein, partial [Pseudomonas sp.]|nr:methyl-accepting chemotaxis protein [Pseudomonas sp.]